MQQWAVHLRQRLLKRKSRKEVASFEFLVSRKNDFSIVVAFAHNPKLGTRGSKKQKDCCERRERFESRGRGRGRGRAKDSAAFAFHATRYYQRKHSHSAVN